MTKNLVLLNVALFIVLTAGMTNAFGQRETATGISVDQDIELMRRDLRAEKKQILAANVPLTETEATKFWPVYDQYAGEMAKLNTEFYNIIKEYAANQKTLSDSHAVDMIKRWTGVQVELALTRQKYMPIFAKIITGKKVALFAQIDRRLYALMDMQTAAAIPLVLQ